MNWQAHCTKKEAAGTEEASAKWRLSASHGSRRDKAGDAPTATAAMQARLLGAGGSRKRNEECSCSLISARSNKTANNNNTRELGDNTRELLESTELEGNQGRRLPHSVRF